MTERYAVWAAEAGRYGLVAAGFVQSGNVAMAGYFAARAAHHAMMAQGVTR